MSLFLCLSDLCINKYYIDRVLTIPRQTMYNNPHPPGQYYHIVMNNNKTSYEIHVHDYNKADYELVTRFLQAYSFNPIPETKKTDV